IFVYESDCMHEFAGKIDELENKLGEDFFRCHRSYIVNFRFVQRYKEGFAYMTSLEKIPIATRRRQEFMQALLRFQRKEVR
ncbi:MAG: LytTR family DNA-binding domain-containing protein, partial [Christensenellaceae bacterium]